MPRTSGPRRPFHAFGVIRPPIIDVLTKLHLLWSSASKGQQGRHPWFPVIRAWQQRPVTTTPNLINDPIMPNKVALFDRRQSLLYAPRSAAREDRFAARFAIARHEDASGQLSLGFGPEKRVLSPALPLYLYDNSRIQKAGGRGTAREANLALRLFVESILSVPADLRSSSRPVELTITRRDLETMLFGEGRKPRPNEYWERLLEASGALDDPEARVPWEDPETGATGWRRVVSFADLPRSAGHLNDQVQILVHLPPGFTAGPLVPDREKLRQWGKTSATVYRLKLNLYWRCFFPGKTRFEVRRKVSLQSQKPAAYGDPITDDDWLVSALRLVLRRCRSNA